ncbi:MAG TPA: hypothetical protein VEZ14_01650 [Dehalococcoidia bacterium]|nr:hypothetical protein [Dehalococcoidia bacterium]
MQTGTTRPDDPGTIGDRRVVETEVERVRTRQRVGGAPVDGAPASAAVAAERNGGYFETLPERLRAVTFAVLTALEVLLGLRFLLRAYAANPSSGFVSFIGDVSWPFVAPFSNIFTNRTWSQGVLEISTLVAMGIYLLIFALIVMLVAALAPRLSEDGGAIS